MLSSAHLSSQRRSTRKGHNELGSERVLGSLSPFFLFVSWPGGKSSVRRTDQTDRFLPKRTDKDLNRVLGRAEGVLAVVCAGLVSRTIAVADRLLFARSSRCSSVSSILRSEHAKRIRPAFEEGAAASSGCYFVESWLLNNIKHSFVNDGCSR